MVLLTWCPKAFTALSYVKVAFDKQSYVALMHYWPDFIVKGLLFTHVCALVIMWFCITFTHGLVFILLCIW